MFIIIALEVCCRSSVCSFRNLFFSLRFDQQTLRHSLSRKKWMKNIFIIFFFFCSETSISSNTTIPKYFVAFVFEVVWYHHELLITNRRLTLLIFPFEDEVLVKIHFGVDIFNFCPPILSLHGKISIYHDVLPRF